MSVRQNERQVSKAEFVNKAYNLTIKSKQFLTSLSRKAEKYYFDSVWELIRRLLLNVVNINNIYTQTNNLFILYYREMLLQDSISCCLSIDMWLSIAFDTTIRNNGVNGEENLPKDSLTLEIVDLLKEEVQLLKGVLRNNNILINKLKDKEPEQEIKLLNNNYSPLLRNSLLYKNNLKGEVENAFYDEQNNKWINND